MSATARRIATAESFEPVAELNITPLIDVLLVLIVMFILTIPLATNELPLDLPGQGVPRADAPVHRLAIDRAGALRWDGAGVEAAALPARLRGVVTRGEELTLAPDARTRFEVVDQTLATVKRAGVTRLGFEGNERYRAF